MGPHQTRHLLDHVNDLEHVIWYSRFKRRWQAMKIHHITLKLFTVASAQTDWILPQFICPSNYLQNLKSADSAILSYQCEKTKRRSWYLAYSSCSTTTSNPINMLRSTAPDYKNVKWESNNPLILWKDARSEALWGSSCRIWKISLTRSEIKRDIKWGWAGVIWPYHNLVHKLLSVTCRLCKAFKNIKVVGWWWGHTWRLCYQVAGSDYKVQKLEGRKCYWANCKFVNPHNINLLIWTKPWLLYFNPNFSGQVQYNHWKFMNLIVIGL